MSTEDQNGLDQTKTGDEFVPPKDGSWVPRQRMNEAVDKVNQKVDGLIAQNARLEERINSQQNQQPKQEAKIYTLPELRAFVADEKISQAQADSIYEQQQQDAVKTQVDTAVKTHLSTSDEKRAIETQLDSYLQLLPDLMTEGSDNRKKVAAEYNRLAATFGMPVADSVDDKKLQIAACQVAFGDVAQLRQAKQRDVTNESRETHQEFGSSEQENVGENDQKVIKKLDSRQRKYYQGMIDKGFYKDWSEVDGELKYAKR